MWLQVKSQLLLGAALLVIVGRAQKQGVFGRRLSSRSNSQSPSWRSGKSLAGTFPFNHRNAQPHHGGHHGQDHHHAAHHDHGHQGFRSSRQDATNNDNGPLDIGTIAAAGERCVDKVVMVQETEYDEQITCKHSYSTQCHITYKTDYEPQQEEECEENYRKKCFIEFKAVASKEKVEFCYTPLVKNCDIPGPEECSTEYRSECMTRYHEHDVEEDHPTCREEFEEKCQEVTQGYSTNEECTKWPITKCTLEKKMVKKYTPETNCKKVPFELCGPSACPVEPGEEQCFDRTETVVQEVPEEQCTLEPQTECKQVTKLVPLLKPAEECVDIPKEVCVRNRVNPKRVQKPIIKKWCYTPTAESGLLPDSQPTPPPPTPGINIPPPNGNQGQQPVTQPPPKEISCTARYPADYCPQRSGNGICNPECNNDPCGFDGGDCDEPPPPPPPPPSCAQGYPATHCPQRAANGICDPECNTNACGLDGGDCEQAAPPNAYLPPPAAAPPNSYLPPPGQSEYGEVQSDYAAFDLRQQRKRKL